MRYRALALLAVLATGCASTSTSSGSCPALRMAAENPAPSHPEIVRAVCPQAMDYPFRNLVLEGGGVKGIAYAGAFEVLEQQGILEQVGPVAGTSAGAITATLVALRYEPDQIRSLAGQKADADRPSDRTSRGSRYSCRIAISGLTRIARRAGR